MSNYTFNERDEGCWADGANGDKHRQAILMDALQAISHLYNKAKELVSEYSDGVPEEFLFEWEDEAIDLINEHCVADMMLEMIDGDLIFHKLEDTSHKDC